MQGNPLVGLSTDEAMRQVDDAVELAIQRHEKFSEAERLIDQTTVTEESPDGAVRATVRSSGALVSLELSNHARTMPPSHLASVITTCVQVAQAGVARRVGDILNAAMPGDPLTEQLAADAHRALAPRPPAPPAAPPARPRSMAGLVRPRRADHDTDHDTDDDWGDQSFMVRANGR